VHAGAVLDELPHVITTDIADHGDQLGWPA
jgi:hypothetical protein